MANKHEHPPCPPSDPHPDCPNTEQRYCSQLITLSKYDRRMCWLWVTVICFAYALTGMWMGDRMKSYMHANFVPEELTTALTMSMKQQVDHGRTLDKLERRLDRIEDAVTQMGAEE